MFNKTFPLALVACFAASALPANAGNVHFHYSADDLATVKDAGKLYTRITARAKEACDSFGRTPLYAKKSEAFCTESLIDELVADVGDARLTQMHAASSSKSYALGQ